MSDATSIRANTIELGASQLKHVLCARCATGLVVRRVMEVRAFCERMEGREMPPDLVECSQFSARDEMGLWEMREIANQVDIREGPPGGLYV